MSSIGKSRPELVSVDALREIETADGMHRCDIDIARFIADPTLPPDARVKRIAPGSRLRAQTRGNARLTERKRFTEIAKKIPPRRDLASRDNGEARGCSSVRDP